MSRNLAMGVAALILWTSAAEAIPVRAMFHGEVIGSLSFPQVLADFPVHTAASFELNFDDADLPANLPATFPPISASGWLRLGSYEWTLDAARVFSVTYTSIDPFPVLRYNLQWTGTGPSIPSGGSLFGLFTNLEMPTLGPSLSNSLIAGFGYPTSSGEFYSYAVLNGVYAIGPVAVAEPGSLALMLVGLGGVAMRLRRRAATLALA